MIRDVFMNPEAYEVNWKEAFRQAWTSGEITPDTTWTWTRLPWGIRNKLIFFFGRDKFYFLEPDRDNIGCFDLRGKETKLSSQGLYVNQSGTIYLFDGKNYRNLEHPEKIYFGKDLRPGIGPKGNSLGGWNIRSSRRGKHFLDSPEGTSVVSWAGVGVFSVFRNQPVWNLSRYGVDVCIGSNHLHIDSLRTIWCRPMNRIGPYPGPTEGTILDPTHHGFFNVGLSVSEFISGRVIDGLTHLVVSRDGDLWLVKQVRKR